jgi:hypothetical protein
MIKRNSFVSKYVNVPKTPAAEAHSTEGQFLLKEKTSNMGHFLIYRTGTRRPTFSEQMGGI